MPTVLTKEYLAELAAAAAKDVAKPIQAALAKSKADVEAIQTSVSMEQKAGVEMLATVQRLEQRMGKLEALQAQLHQLFDEHLQHTEQTMLAVSSRSQGETSLVKRRLEQVDRILAKVLENAAKAENRRGK